MRILLALLAAHAASAATVVRLDIDSVVHPVTVEMMTDTIRHAREGFRLVGRGCMVAGIGPEPRYATVSQLVGRLDAFPEAKMLITAISEAVERYQPEEEAVIVLETEHAINVMILGPRGVEEIVGGIDFAP